MIAQPYNRYNPQTLRTITMSSEYYQCFTTFFDKEYLIYSWDDTVMIQLVDYSDNPPRRLLNGFDTIEEVLKDIEQNQDYWKAYFETVFSKDFKRV